MTSKKYSRRDALRFLGLSGTGAVFGPSALEILVGSVLSGMAERALAQSGVTPRRHLFIQLAGAPPRWTFDLFLTPFSTSAALNPDAMVATAFTESGGRYTGATYKTALVNGIHAPWLWQFDVPRAGGGKRPMAELMNHMLSVRGIAVEDFQHESAQVKSFMPLGSTNSIMALAAENSGTPIPTLDVDTIRYTFKSSSSITPVRLRTSGNMLESLLDPFTRKTGSGFISKRNALSQEINGALAALKGYAVARHPQAGHIFESQKGAQEMIQGAIGDISQIWSSLLGKYRDIVNRGIAIHDQIPGISDRPIGNGASNGDHYVVNAEYYIKDADMRDAFTGLSATDLAEHFAVAEYVLLNGISGSIAICPGCIYGVKAGGSRHAIDFDEHYIGTMVSLLTNSLYNRAFAGCMLELIDRLKAANMFHNTVIDLRGEFGRYGRNDGSGSDHAENAGIASFYSGIIDGPLLVGDIQRRWGYGEAASVPQLGGKLDMGHLASTIATLIGVPSPVTARSSVVGIQGGKVVSLIGTSKQV